MSVKQDEIEYKYYSIGLGMAAVLPYGILLPWPYIFFLAIVLVSEFVLIKTEFLEQSKRSKTIVKIIFMIAGMLFIIYYWNQLQINIIGLALFCLVLSLKPLETRSQRDYQVLIVLCYFAVIALLFFDNSFLLFFYSSLYIIVLTAFVIMLHFPGESYKDNIISSVRLLIKTAPMVLIVFIIFPRLGTPVWHLSSMDGDHKIGANGQGISGLSNSLNPGDLSKLSLSQETAFRVTFNQHRPAADELYWRANSYYFSDGKQWLSDYYLKSYFDLQVPIKINHIAQINKQMQFKYTINQAASHQQWLFTLGTPIELQSISNTQAVLSEDNLLLAKAPVHDSVQYTQISYANPRVAGTFNNDQQALILQALQLPENKRLAHKTISLGQQWRKTYADDKSLLKHALKWFAQEEFYYSRDVPNYSVNPIDEFLFQGKKGYCGHYATAFAMLMRAAQIPARVVSGYKGGQTSRFGDYLTIKQANAHAWVEVWLGKQGWSRIDPTAVIPAARVLEDDLLSQIHSEASEQMLEEQNTSEQSAEKAIFEGRFLRQFKLYSEYLDYVWDVWIVQYDQTNQHLLLAITGLDRLNTVWIILVAVFIICFAMVVAKIVQWQKQTISLRVVYQSLLMKLQEQGIKILHNEGPETLKKRLLIVFQERNEAHKCLQIVALIDRYIELRYNDKGQQIQRQHIVELKRQIELIKKTKKSLF